MVEGGAADREAADHVADEGIALPVLQHRLGLAARTGDLPMLGKLLEAGVDINTRGRNRQTALELAERHGNWDAERLLEDAGAGLSGLSRFMPNETCLLAPHRPALRLLAPGIGKNPPRADFAKVMDLGGSHETRLGADEYHRKEHEMPLIPGSQLLERFRELVGEAHQIDIAVAWASSCDAIEVLSESDAKIRAVIGTSGNSTNPSTLRHVLEFAKLRVPPNNPPQIFHPKYYCFHGEKTVCWVGSANLTRGGFGGNAELVHEFKLRKKGDRKWFECLWEGLEQDPWPAIREYEARYDPPKRTPRPPRGPGGGADRDLPSLADINTWKDFVEGIRAYDEYYRHHEHDFDVLGETHSWRHTIDTGHEIVLLNDWANLTQRECRILRGLTVDDDNEGKWALLGWVRGGGAYVFNRERMPDVGPIRMQIQEQINQALQADQNEIIAVGTGAMMTISQLQHVESADRGIGHAAATRWLALARPDCFVSVNSASASGLGEASGLPQNPGGLANVYTDLLGWLHDQDWFMDPQPDDPVERDIWKRRAALVDVFVYDA